MEYIENFVAQYQHDYWRVIIGAQRYVEPAFIQS
ncbi:hypothetical protein BH160DRAFT_4538 [Burkholderia sp. H160]|nr:hypothetical protein BH160DRAFT_4538 [Burkholderia sp. H160]